MKKAFVTGARGLIGRNTIEHLEKRRFDIIAPNSKELNLLEHNRVQNFIELHKPNYLLHLAWDVTPVKCLHSPLNDALLKASENLLYHFKLNGGQRIMAAGTCSEYFYDNPYSASKRALLEILKNMDISYAWGRLFYQFGENEHPDRLVPYVINSLLDGKEAKCSSGEQIRDYMYVKDTARACVELLDGNVQGIIDIGTGEGRKVKDIINTIAKRLNKQHLIRLGEMERADNDVERIVADTARLRKEVGFSPQYTVDEGLERVINWHIMMHRRKTPSESKN